MEKIIRLQDAKFKILPNNNNETSIFIEQSIASSLGLSDGAEHIFSINKENILKALSFTYSLQKNIYRKQDIVSLDNTWFKKEYDLIVNHFGSTSEYKVEISEATGGRFYMKSLKQSSGLNIRNILIQDHFKIIFSNTNNDLKIDYSNEPYSLDNNIDNLLSEPNSIYGLKSGTQKIFYGAPGTGKSHKVNILAKNKDDRMQRVTFHPEYDYASFIGGYKPTMAEEDGKEVIKYKFVPQAFTNIYVNAWNDPNNDYYLVIEEINRGNCAEIFGDIFQLLDRDSDYDITPSIELESYLKSMLVDENKGLENGKLKLPDNLTIYATMNTSDQSLFPMDSAFKRRWDWEYIPICYEELTDEGKPNPSFHYVVDLGNGSYFKWNDFISKVNLNHIQQNPVLGMDKCMGNYFVKPKKGKTSIDVETFINKAIFYLWNDVFKDEKNEVFEENSSYEDFFPINTKGVQKLTELLERLEVTVNTSPENSAPIEDEVTN